MTIECRKAPHGRDIISIQGSNEYIMGRIVRTGHDCRVTIGTFDRVFDGMGQAEEKAEEAAAVRVEKPCGSPASWGQRPR